MSYPTFNGWQVINPPTSPGPTQIEIELLDAVSQLQSPFNLNTQSQVWLGAESMMWNVSLPAMRTTTAQAWLAWLKSLQGIANVFQLGDANHKTPMGTPSGTPLVDGSDAGYNLPALNWLRTKGWTASASNLLLPGDYIQIGYRLHTVLQAVTADGSGNALINIWPSLREQPADNAAIVTSNTKGLFRLAENKRSYTEHVGNLTAISFKAVEAR